MQTNTLTETPFEYCGIRCTERALLEIHGGKVMVTVPRQELQTIALRHGIQSPHPLLQILVGCALIGTGYFPACIVIDWLRHGGTLAMHLTALFVPMVVIGIWLVVSAMKRGHFLEAELKGEVKRLAFHAKIDSAELENFVSGVERRYGIRIAR